MKNENRFFIIVLFNNKYSPSTMVVLREYWPKVLTLLGPSAVRSTQTGQRTDILLEQSQGSLVNTRFIIQLKMLGTMQKSQTGKHCELQAHNCDWELTRQMSDVKRR